MNINELDNNEIKLHTYVTNSGIGSRRKTEEFIRSGHIYVNGVIVTKPEIRIFPQRDIVTYNDKRLLPYTKMHYILLNKPVKVMTTLNDPQKRKTVMDFIPKELPVVPVGRLDYDSEGVILLTNDGDLAKRILSPRHHVPKTYLVRVKGMPDVITIAKLRKGIYMDGYRTKPAFIKLISKNRESSLYKMILEEGKNRQIRNMFKYSGFPVLALVRVSIGNLKVEQLKPGEYRLIPKKQISELANFKYSLDDKIAANRPERDTKKPDGTSDGPRRASTGGPGRSSTNSSRSEGSSTYKPRRTSTSRTSTSRRHSTDGPSRKKR